MLLWDIIRDFFVKYVFGGTCIIDGGLGNNVYVRHIYNGKNYVSRYGHLSEVYVSVGDIVTEDTVIGAVGCTGYSFGFHLDY